MTEEFFLQGRLTEIRFAELILRISERKETGVLYLSRGSIEKHVFFQEGKIVFARSNDADERLGALFLRRNKITYRQLADAEVKVVPGKRLGTVLVLDGYITPSDLYQGVIDQIREILYGIFEWEDGHYEFTPGNLPSDEVITLNLSTPDIILSGLSRIWRWSWVKSGSMSLDAVFRKRDGWSLPTRKMTMTPELHSVLDLLDRPRTLEEILLSSKMGNFETCRLVWGLLLLGIAEQILAAPSWAAQAESQTQELSPTSKMQTPIMTPLPFAPTEGETTVVMKTPEAKDEVVVAEAKKDEITQPVLQMPDQTEALREESTTEHPIAEPEVVEPKVAEPEVEEVPAQEQVAEQPIAQETRIEAPIVAEQASEAVAVVQPIGQETPSEAAVPSEEITKPAEVERGKEAPEQIPPADLSFSDLADLTDTAEHLTPLPPPPAPEIIESWEAQLPADIKLLNEQHRYLFEMLRLELGTGVNPFLSKMVKKVSAKFPLVFDGVRLNDFGEFDESSLIANVEGNLVEKYREAFRYLIDEELGTIHGFLDKKRVASLENGLARISEKQRVIT